MNSIHQHLLERDIIHADETPCQVLKEEGIFGTVQVLYVAVWLWK